MKDLIEKMDGQVAASYKNIEDMNRWSKSAVRRMDGIKYRAEKHKLKLKEIKEQQVKYLISVFCWAGSPG